MCSAIHLKTSPKRLFRKVCIGSSRIFPAARERLSPKVLKTFSTLNIWDANMKEKIERVLLGYSPPLSRANINELTEALMVEWRKATKQLAAEQKRRLSLARAKQKKRESGKAKKLGSVA
jgi:hypothetical protein